MSWARYDDELPMNRKVAWLKSHGIDGIAALGLHLLANAWSRHEGHQGFIPSYIPEQLVGRPWRRLTDLLADEAIAMFEPVDAGWMINDYDQYGDRDDGVSVEEKKQRLSKVRAEAGRAGGKAKASNRPSKPVAELEAKRRQSSSPVPEPVPGTSVGRNGGGGVERAEPPPPSRNLKIKGTCPAHPEGTSTACADCRADRLRIEVAESAREAQAAAAAAAEADRRRQCPRCDDKGLREVSDSAVTRCDHQPESRAS